MNQERLRLDLSNNFSCRAVGYQHGCQGVGVTIPRGVQNHRDVALGDKDSGHGGVEPGILEGFSSLGD